MLADGDGLSNSNGTSRNGSRSLAKADGHSNGAHKEVIGGGAALSQNGKEVARSPSRIGTYFGHDREEVTRILIQALEDMGYHDAAESVSRDSGYSLEGQTVAEFRSAVLRGSWSEAERLLFGAATATSSGGNGQPSHQGNGLVLAPGADRNVMRFWLRQQKFLELLEQRETSRALMVLRNELTPLYQDTSKLHFLSSLLMCQSPEDLKLKAEWDGAHGHSREILLTELSHCISPAVMLPEHRLAVLLQQVKDGQILNCLYHTTASSPTLYSDHYCEKSRFPTEVVRELDRSRGEIWQLLFSHDGTQLASSGSDDSVILWDVSTFEMRLKLEGHGQGVGNFAWSPDDTMMVTCGRDNYARIWDTETGSLVKTLPRFNDPVSSCVWSADGQTMIIGSFDKERPLCQWNLEGECVYTYTRKHRTEDLVLSLDGHWLVAKDSQPEKKIHIYNMLTREPEYEWEFKVQPTSISISQDSRLLLVSHKDGVVQLYDLISRGSPVQRYTGCTGGDYIVRNGFGGANESFVISGSEDGKLAIWHKATGHLVSKLEAHMPRCNAVCWNPTDPCMFASGGDDGKIKIWSNSDHRCSMHYAPKPTSSSNGASRDPA